MNENKQECFESIKQHLEDREIAIKLLPFFDHIPAAYKTPDISNRITRINRLVKLYAPEVIIENERNTLFELINMIAAKHIFDTIQNYMGGNDE